MFDYTKETVLNVVDGKVVAMEWDDTSTPAKYVPVETGTDGTLLIIKKEANFDQDKIACVYRANGKYGSHTEVVFDLTKFDNPGETYRVEFKVMSDQKFQEFSSPNWQEFNMPIMAEFVGDATEATLAKNLIDAIELVGKGYFTFTYDSTAKTVTALLNEDFLWVAKDGVRVYDAEACIVDACTGEAGRGPELVANAAKVVYGVWAPNTDTGVMEETFTDDAALRVVAFATCNWLLQNYRLPTAANLRFNSANAEEMPSAPLYAQYVVKYNTPRFIGGTSVIGQQNMSFTNHVYYIPMALDNHGNIDVTSEAGKFEAELAKLGLNNAGAADNYDACFTA